MKFRAPISKQSEPDQSLSITDVQRVIETACPAKDYRNKKILLIVPDGTRTAPVGLLFKTLYEQIGSNTKAFDVLIALGPHPPMTQQAMCERLEISLTERTGKYADVGLFNHEWD